MLQSGEHGTGPASSPPHSGAEVGEVPWRTLVVEFVNERKGTAWSRSENAPSATSRLQVDLGDPSFAADLSANLKQAGLVSTLILRGHCPPLPLLVDVCLVCRASLRALELDMFAPLLSDPASSPGSKQDSESPLVPGIPTAQLALRRLSCKLGRDGLPSRAPSIWLIEWLVSSGSCTGLEDMSVAIFDESGDGEASVQNHMGIVNTLLYAANGSLQRFEAIGYPTGIRDGALTLH